MLKTTTAALALLATTLAAVPQAAPPPPARTLTMPVTGAGDGGALTGTFELQRFATSDGGVVAVGVLTGTVTTAAGTTTSIVRTLALPVAVGDATCEILHLDLGPLSLDLLGLQIDLSRIVLDITAQAGAGNLLGNLLCAVVNLLNDPTGLSRLLNQILAALLG